MANDSMNRNQGNTMSSNQNQTLRHEQAKASVGGERSDEQSGMSKGSPETTGEEKSAIGGGETRDRSKTGEPGRARNELDPDGGSEFDSSRSETSGRR